MKKLFALLLTASLFIFSTCSQSPSESPPFETSATPPILSSNAGESSVASESKEPIAPLESAPEIETDAPEVGGGNGSTVCQEHTVTFHSVEGRLIDFAGKEAVKSWYLASGLEEDPYGRYNEGFTIAAFVEKFNISKEDFIRLTREHLTEENLALIGLTKQQYYEQIGYTDAQIDAIYSGDQKQINEAFCGELAFVNDADGELYSIYWLADHSAEDYIAADLPLDEVERILEKASQYSYYDTLAASAKTVLAEAVELAK